MFNNGADEAVGNADDLRVRRQRSSRERLRRKEQGARSRSSPLGGTRGVLVGRSGDSIDREARACKRSRAEAMGERDGGDEGKVGMARWRRNRGEGGRGGRVREMAARGRRWGSGRGAMGRRGGRWRRCGREMGSGEGCG